jgi:probable rRNA maturation factor
MIEIFNEQNKIKIKPEEFLAISNKVIEHVHKSQNRYLTIVFVSDQKIKRLNKNYRQKNYPTDVLSFPNEADDFDDDKNYLGDIVISAEQARKQAIENNLSLELEIKQLILHGILHLSGFDHETDNGEMNELELTLRDKLKIN